MNCEETFRRLQDYLDRELSPTELEEVQAHLNHCGPCEEEYRFEQSVLRHVRRCMGEEPCPDDLLARVQLVLDRECG
jgi:mycothiol system anti-sigma-R factor